MDVWWDCLAAGSEWVVGLRTKSWDSVGSGLQLELSHARGLHDRSRDHRIRRRKARMDSVFRLVVEIAVMGDGEQLDKAAGS
jgi:hypothetical protein